MDSEGALEQILQMVGDNGRYQTYLVWLFFLPVSIIAPFAILLQTFQASVPDHWCHVPGKPENISLEQWKYLTIPWNIKEGKEVLSKCEQFSVVQSQANSNESHETEGCKNGWDFDQTWYDKTLPMDMEWVCEKDFHSARWISAGFAGKIIGTFLFNGLSDQFGRKGGIILGTQWYAVFAIARLYVTSEWGLLILMFLSSMAFPAVFSIPWTFVVEQVSKEGRSKVVTISYNMWAIGGSILALLAWYTRDWVKLGLITSLPYFSVILHWWFFPESPRWLLSKGRVKESFKAFQRIAKINGKVCPDNLEERLEKLASRVQKTSGNKWISFTFLDLLKHPLIRKRILLLSASLSCNVLVYYGIVYNTSTLSGNKFLNFFYMMISEIPSNFVGWICAETLGRRASAVVFFFLAAVTAFITTFISFLDSWLEIFLTVICKGFGNICFFVIILQNAEIQPTSHRASGSGICSILASILGMLSPYIAYSKTAWSALPYALLTGIGLAGAVSSLLLPETLGENLPQTLFDAQNFLPDESFWSYKGWRPGSKNRSKRTHQLGEGGNINYAMSENELSDKPKPK